MLHWALRSHGLTLLNSLLVHCFQPGHGGRRGDGGDGRQPQDNTGTAHRALLTNMTTLLDSATDDDKVIRATCAPYYAVPTILREKQARCPRGWVWEGDVPPCT